jgi:predicted O-methyltransferase YrrM
LLSETVLEADALVDQLFEKGDSDFLRSAISQEEGRFLQDLAARPHVQNTIEVGCANAVSSICICSGISSKAKPSHTAIDPFQFRDFEGRGVENVRRAGFNFFELVERPSEIALPDLLSRGMSYELAFIDGLHTADQTLLDFYYLDRMIPVGGIIVIDDVNGRSVNKIAHYVSTYPNYRLIGTSGHRGTKRWLVNFTKQAIAALLWPGRKIFGDSAMREVFDISLLQPERLWTIDFSTMVAFEKTSQFARDTNWYRGL